MIYESFSGTVSREDETVIAVDGPADAQRAAGDEEDRRTVEADGAPARAE